MPRDALASGCFKLCTYTFNRLRLPFALALLLSYIVSSIKHKYKAAFRALTPALAMTECVPRTSSTLFLYLYFIIALHVFYVKLVDTNMENYLQVNHTKLIL